MTSRELLRAAARELAAAGVPDPAYDAGQLLAKVTGMPALELRAGFAEISAEQEASFRALMDRRKAREPLQYLLGDTVFLGRSFHVRPGVLIPRPETEMLAESAIRWARERSLRVPHPEVLDLCCGSGCIGISVQLQCPQIRCTMTDLSPEALAVTRENAERLQAACEILSGDLFEAAAGRTFDLILCNPPYIPGAECDALQAEVMREPRMALDGGADGLDFYRRITEGAARHLKEGGWLLAEIGFDQGEAVRSMFVEHQYKETEIRKDLSGLDRVVLGRLGSV